MNSRPNILHIPDEILIEMILNLNVTERVALGDSCKKFRALVFEDTKLLRDLDFSKEWLCSSASQDIRRYFNNEISRRHILRVNLRNFGLLGSADLPNYFHRAINLVDLNTHGLTFTNVMQLERFICPFQNLKRLSCDWPAMITVSCHIPKNLGELLGRLTYWSVRLSHFQEFTTFHNALRFCQELKELRVTMISSLYPNHFSHDNTIRRKILKSIERIKYYGKEVEEVERYYVSLIPCPKEWTHFFISDPITCEAGFYLERNVEMCEELMEKKSMNSLVHDYPKFASKLGRFVVPACLLEEVMRINGEHLQGEFCCFSSPLNDAEKWWGFRSVVFNMSKRWTLKPEEAKRLMKDPRYQISYLNIFHDIEEKCDAHVVTSAFSSLTELVLSDVTKNKQTRDSDKLDQLRNLDSSFSKLVRSTPHVKHLTVIADKRRYKNDEIWDLASLHLIPSWQGLTSLRLRYLPIMDGNFFVEIGKQCKQLDTIELVHLGPCCYMKGLMRMLIHCTNLRYFTLRDDYINRLTDLLFSLADNNSQLKSVCIRSGNITETYGDLRLPVERLLRCCSQLTKFLCLVEMWSRDETENEECRELRSALERLRSELNRPYCQVQLNLFNDYVREDESTVPHCIRVDLP